MTAPQYDEAYYQGYKGEPYGRGETWLRLFGNFAAHIVRDLKPASALDAGCAMGLLVEALRERGVEAFGFDISDYAISQAAPEIRPFLWQASVTDPLDRHYDVIITLEVLEHLPPEQADAAVANLCAHTDDIIFSSTPDDFREPTHLNVRPPDYWAEIFAHHGFYRDVDYEVSYISSWAVRFRRGRDSFASVVRGYERLSDRLQRENRELREVLVERHDAALQAEARLEPLQAEFQTAEAELAASREEVAAMRATLAWRAAERARRMLKRLGR